MIVATYWVASSVTQPVFGALAESLGLKLVGALGVVFAATFLSLIGVAPALVAVFALLIVGGMGSAALHPVGTTIAGGPTVKNRSLGVGFFTAGGMIGFAIGPVPDPRPDRGVRHRRHPMVHGARARARRPGLPAALPCRQSSRAAPRSSRSPFAAGLLLYTSSPVKVVVAQDLAPHAPAAAAGVVLGLTSGLGGVLYIALGKLQEIIGLGAGMTVGFLMVIPSAILALLVLRRHPDVAR